MSRPVDGLVRQFRVYVEQVNQTCVDVAARSASEARDKGYAKWRREYAHSRVSYVEELPNARNQGLAPQGETDAK
jgi:hypothetical protein